LPGPAQAWRAGPCVTATVGLPACHPGILADIPPGAAIDDDPIFIAASGEAKRHRFSITKNLTFFRIDSKSLNPILHYPAAFPRASFESGSGPAQAGRTEFFMLASMRCCTLVSNSRSL
jgi:hypothetical protein